MAPALVVGFGNTLMGDDGVGLVVVERLTATGLPARTRAVTLSTDSLRLAAVWRGEPEVLLIDALIRGAPPGTIHRLDHSEVLTRPQRHGSVHHLSLSESLRWIALAYPEMVDVRYRLWGVEPGTVHAAEGLSAPVAAAAERVVEEILAEVAPPTARPGLRQ